MFNLGGIPPAPRGVPQVEVTFEIDANGILNVSAKDLGTGKESKITITASTKLSKEEKDKMVRDSEQYAEQDKRKMEEAHLLNEADSVLYTAEKTKTDLTGKINDSDTSKIDSTSRELRKAVEAKDFDEVKRKTDSLKKVLQDIGTAVYQRSSKESPSGKERGAPPGEEQEGAGEGNVTDAEYKVVDEDKK
jgi:molecular chaperone DnaK